jgi:rod shape-determining protein MreC
MRNLLNFLIKYNYWLLFLFLEVISFVLLFRYNHYQESYFFNSANAVTGKIYEVSGGISSYFHLKGVNRDLLDRNMELEAQISNLEKALKAHQVDSVEIVSLERLPRTSYYLFKANVINNSLNLTDNFITIDKGSADGIRPDMGVVDANGVVGIVYEVSRYYSTVISLLNGRSNISCKIVGSNYFGNLKWDHSDAQHATLGDLPRQAQFNLGDTVVTSGYSSVFPAGIMVGTVDDMGDSENGLTYLLKVKLAADFGRISDVRVIARRGYEEQKALERKNTVANE